MKTNTAKNLGSGILFSAILTYSMILHYSLTSIIIAAVSVGLVLITVFVNGKEKKIVEKVDLLFLIEFIGITALNYNDYLSFFDYEKCLDRISYMNSDAYEIIIPTIIAGFIIKLIGKNRKSPVTKVIWKYIGKTSIAVGLSVFVLAAFSYDVLVVLFCINALFGLVEFFNYCRTNKPNKRISFISFLTSFIYILFKALFVGYNGKTALLTVFLNEVVLPWYSLLVITVIILSTVGAASYINNGIIDEDMVFLTGLLAFVFVLKADVYFSFKYSWIVLCVFVLFVLGFSAGFVSDETKKRGTKAISAVTGNNVLWKIGISALSAIGLIFLADKGYAVLGFSLLVAVPATIFVPRIASGWRRDALFWIMVVASTAFAAVMISTVTGTYESVFKLIIGSFVFTAAVMWMLNHKNNVGHNRFTAVKVIVSVVFAVLMLIVAF